MLPRLKLRHINFITTYNCTTQCSVCDYCYTFTYHDQIKKIDEKKILDIINNICLYPPESCTITGGNPLLLSQQTLQTIISTLRQNNIIVKIHINSADLEKFLIPLDCDTYYISVNSSFELNRFADFYESQKIDKTKIIATVTVTILNIFELPDILRYMYKHNIHCILHYLLAPNSQKVAIYANKQAIQYFHLIIAQYKYSNLFINLHEICNAGINECTILPNGDVVPCVYSILLEDQYIPEGNILEESLQHIWETRFKNRYHDFICCKDIINVYPNVNNVIQYMYDDENIEM